MTSRGEVTPDDRSRRQALFAGLAALTALVAPSAAGAQGRVRVPVGPTERTPRHPTTPLKPALVDPAATWLTPELRLARRVTMGLNDAEAVRARQMGYSAYLDYQLDAESIDDSVTDSYVAASWPTTTQDASTLFSANAGTVQTELTLASVFRAAFSARQLKERMVEFWSDHFNIYYPKVAYLKVIDDREVIRANALTTFPQLLRATAHSPAMLVYLDQSSSRKGAPNQNYAREIMELHTLGVNGGYTQTDVAELSRVLTGWTIAARGAAFTFDPNLHDFGAKTVLGVTIPAAATSVGAAAVNEGEQMLTLLVNHPSTATFIAAKMLQYFLRYDPSPGQIAAVAAVYANTGGDIKAMMRAVLSPENLLAAPAKFKRPYHFILSAVRALSPVVTPAGAAAINAQVNVAGQAMFNWLTPDGYPDTAQYWAGNFLPRWNAAASLANANSATSILFNVAPWMTPATTANVVAQIDRYVFAGEMPPRLRDELSAYIGANPSSAARVREAVGLAMSSSSFQYY
ncbi:MAG: DUF1800 domain-containing protein [Gemmatimonadetes bacterium]|nr:DUF1800 domain-containing protein [Gemmatimonadota bacterium]MBI3569125.1 DUF1800 domain-containing protein [Gemmatimonadota bacterium]